ncbi:hypothetical protein BH10PLA2_BH10PLA2_17010 [soil metagenome]
MPHYIYARNTVPCAESKENNFSRTNSVVHGLDRDSPNLHDNYRQQPPNATFFHPIGSPRCEGTP